jgi:peptidoglycan/LPS O-acetylase OafA/YrhL
METSARQKLASIQALRAIAALMVVQHHSWLSIRYFEAFVPGWRFSFLKYGFTGVDLFFLISGYIFCHMAAGRPFALGAFLWNRFWRIYPNYWVFTSLVVLAHALNPGWNLGGNPYTAASVVSSYLILPQAVSPLLFVGWTLEKEVAFYLIFAALNAVKKARWLIPVLAALGLAGLAGVARHYAAAFLISGFMLEFAAGAAIFRYRAKLARLGWGLPLAAGLAGAFTTLSWMDFFGEASGASFPVRVAGLTISYGALMVSALNLEMGTKVFKSRVGAALVTVGEASYSLYLANWLVFSVLGKLALAARLTRFAWFEPIYYVGAIVATIAFSLAYYALVERRLIGLKDVFRAPAALAPGAAIFSAPRRPT